MQRGLRIALWVALGMLLLAEAIAMTGIVSGPARRFLLSARSPQWVAILGSITLHAFVLYAAYSAPRWRGPLLALAAGAAIDAALWPFAPDPAGSPYLWIAVLAAGPGLVSLGVLIAGATGEGGQRAPYRLLLEALAILAIYVLGVVVFQDLTRAMHPATLDPAAYRIDSTYGFLPSTVAVLAAREPAWLLPVLATPYDLLPYGFALLFALQLRDGRRWPAHLFLITALSGAVAVVLYQVCPIAGPKYAFGDAFPSLMPPPESLDLAPDVVAPAPRNGMPSMHLAWALLLWFNALHGSRAVRNFFALFLGFTALATLALGEHYLVDLVAGVPVALALQAACSATLPWAAPARRRALWTGVAGSLFWVLGVRFAPAVFVEVPGFTWIATLLTLAACWAPFRRLHEEAAPMPGPEPRRTPVAPAAPLPRPAIAMFLASGFAGLVYQVLFSKALALTFGATSTATYTVLATYMGGMALGAWLGGLLAERRADGLRLYGLCELGIGLYCIATPLLFAGIRELYVAVAAGVAPDAGSLTVLRVALGGAALAVPTVLMGMTLPLLARALGAGTGSLGVPVALLYGANTLGAAFGALIAGYVILVSFGIFRTTLLAAALNLAVAFSALRLHGRGVGTVSEGGARAAAGEPGAAERGLGRLCLVILAIGGFVTLALEVDYVHLLAVVAGNSVYAFSLMLFAFLLGLGGGAELGRRLLGCALPLPMLLAGLEFGLVAAILGGVFMWNALPGYFASFAIYPAAEGFGAREFIRGAVCWVVMFPVAFFIGSLYPVAMEGVGRAFPTQRLEALGRAAALNTAGNILGVLVAGFLVLPTVGALRSVQMLAAMSFGLGLAALLQSAARRSARAWAPALGLLLLFAAQPSSLDYTALASGANVYFRPQHFGTAIDHAESVDGGLTTVVERRAGAGKIRTLLTNGKFQGNDDVAGEMPAQVGIAVAPLLHTPARGAALVIGYGSGVSARTMHEAGFARLDVVDLSADIVRLANAHFAAVNGRVTAQPGVHTYITDGRNFLMLQPRSYDVISLEISSIWFAGAASLYNREFYQLVRRRLRPDGVLQQWIQLHHLEPVDLLYVLGSVRAELRYVWLYFIGNQGIIVASNDPARAPRRENFAVLARTPSFAPLLKVLGGYSSDLFDTLVLDPAGTDAFLGAFGRPAAFWRSTDDNLFLEYHTPRGNALDGGRTLRANLEALSSFGPGARARRRDGAARRTP